MLARYAPATLSTPVEPTTDLARRHRVAASVRRSRRATLHAFATWLRTLADRFDAPTPSAARAEVDWSPA